MEVFGYPVQIGKVQPPMLPEETLRRDRLLDWLHAKTRSRLALIVADPGYGKTTLLADWSRRTRVRTIALRFPRFAASSRRSPAVFGANSGSISRPAATM